MIPREVMKNVRRIQIRTTRMVNDVFAGQYRSVFKGRGMEFEEVREYQPGDEVGAIDWNVTARTGRPHVKKFVEERELTVMLVVDVSGSSQFGSRERFKAELAAELCAVLAFSAIRAHDRVGLLMFTDRIEKFVPPRKGSRHVLRVIREVLYAQPAGRGTDLAQALEYLNRVTRRHTVTFLVSDFAAGGYRMPLTVAGKRHDVVAVAVGDRREEELPRVGLVELEDTETGERLLLDTGSARVRREYAARARERREGLERMFRKAGVDSIAVRTGEPYVDALLRFFRMRERRM
jgi:uncharacterized protein (DUF58 family)